MQKSMHTEQTPLLHSNKNRLSTRVERRFWSFILRSPLFGVLTKRSLYFLSP